MSILLKDIIDSSQCELFSGSAETVIRGVCSLDEPQKGCITFALKVKVDKLDKAFKSGISALILPKDITSSLLESIKAKGRNNISLLLSKNPLLSISKIASFFDKRELPFSAGVSEKAYLASSVQLGERVAIAPFAFVSDEVEIGDGSVIYPNVFIGKGCKLGKNVVIYPGVVIYQGTEIGDNVVIHSGSVIGADGFGYVEVEGKLSKIPQIGRVIIKQGVEIGANVCIDRAAFGTTVIGEGTKIDNLVQIGHNVKIGKGCIVCGNVGIAGSVEIGDRVVIGGGVGIADHIKIVSGVRLAAYSGVANDILKPGDYGGAPAKPAKEWKRILASQVLLPKVLNKLKKSRTEIKE
ncbi:MAG: UDP-3-O-(3-hydroxymyristoyl)glucosamine N-acyltransferase [Candidatus Dadabacteria bacterium]|nr:MAG: UDP-3-O-(3-hydroxymyristoyl)glucosamine N-acyltransferase [Candidatus Dadabacteria bacterium]